ncbi:RagB/SusD family nutrient uptake outer membrane protein [Ferruginibacter yonginensis]|uniref:RagB/SusD family nutrient uptake outer membrane protein n=1 Tax=Ferruginibacter yonginensis TaxID=1310416 RepID=A0ABV8QPQ5_9BACT
MKKILIGSFFAASILSTGCKKLLDKLPTDAQPGEEVLKSSSNVLSVLAASYSRFTDNNFVGGEVQRTAELYGNQVDLANATGGAPAQFVSRSFNIFNQIGRDIWFTGYEAIGRANVVLNAIDNNTFNDTTAAAKNTWKGEALFIRGAAHFELVRIFAKPYTANPTSDPGVVLRLRALNATEAQQQVQRSTVKQSYDAAIADLKAAEQLLPTTNGVRATRWAAKAYLARIYFNMADYANAFAYANDVITNGGFALGTDVKAPFTTTGNVASFPASVVFGVLGDGGRLRGNFWNSDLNNTFLPIANATFSNINARGGNRATFLSTSSTSGKGVSLKWSVLGDVAINVPVVRLSEMYLIRAEARVQTGTFTDAAVRADYNAVRAVAGVVADNSTSGATALLTAIRNERQVELFTEGDSYHELRRLKQSVRGIAFDDATGLLKIPDGEVRVNPGMIQN